MNTHEGSRFLPFTEQPTLIIGSLKNRETVVRKLYLEVFIAFQVKWVSHPARTAKQIETCPRCFCRKKESSIVSHFGSGQEQRYTVTTFKEAHLLADIFARCSGNDDLGLCQTRHQGDYKNADNQYVCFSFHHSYGILFLEERSGVDTIA